VNFLVFFEPITALEFEKSLINKPLIIWTYRKNEPIVIDIPPEIAVVVVVGVYPFFLATSLKLIDCLAFEIMFDPEVLFETKFVRIVEKLLNLSRYRNLT